MTDHHDAGLMPMVMAVFGGGFIAGLIVGVIAGLTI